MPRFKNYKYDEWAAGALRTFEFRPPQALAVDTETSGFGYFDDAFCATASWRSGGEICSAYLDFEDDDHGSRLAIMKKMLDAADVWVFHNAKFDLQKLDRQGALPTGWQASKRIEDTATMYALINENDRKGLKYLAKKLLHEDTNEDEVLAKVRRKLKIKKDDGYHLIPRQYVAPYAIMDTVYTLRLFEYLQHRLPEDMRELYRFEVGLELTLLDIESNGIGLDMTYLDTTTSEYGIKVMRGQMDLCNLTGRESFNPNSPKQILEAFADRGFTLDSTDKATLSQVDDDLARILLEYRTNKKLHGTYLLAMKSEQRDGIIHPNFNLTTPRTGRMSSGAATNN